MTLWLVRHGQTTFNAEGRIQGGCDSPLTDLGQAQAARVGRLLADLTQDQAERMVWCSPQGRAQHTARIIAAAMGIAAPLRLEPRIRELELGSWEKRTPAEINAETPGACLRGQIPDWCFRSPDGETQGQIEGRLRAFLDEMAAGSGCRIVVAHGLSGRVMRGLYAGLDPLVALDLDVPQDAVFRLAGGTITRFDAP